MSYEQQRAEIFQAVQAFQGGDFEALALKIFRFQAAFNKLYGRFLALLKVDFQEVSRLEDVPFLPIQFFKNHAVKTGDWQAETTFTSSGTTGATTSQHFVRDLNFYRENAAKGFRNAYGELAGRCVLALLPSYLERGGSSLVCMAEDFIRRSGHRASGFFLGNEEELVEILALGRTATPPAPPQVGLRQGLVSGEEKNYESRILAGSQPPLRGGRGGGGAGTLLLGVSFALLDLAERHSLDLQDVIIMETGGMKGRRQELTREELHEILKNAFHVRQIHSEYGMTELFSQAYSAGEGRFRPAPTMRVLTREITDPLTLQRPGKTGVLNVVDLANFDTCSFIATDDLGRVFEDGSFEVLGRTDESDVRGCNLMVA